MEQPFNIRLQKAKDELKFAIDRITVKYQIPGAILNLMLDSIGKEGLEAQLSLMAQQIKEEQDVEN